MTDVTANFQLDAADGWVNIGSGPMMVQLNSAYDSVRIEVSTLAPADGTIGWVISPDGDTSISISESINVWAAVVGSNTAPVHLSVIQTDGSAAGGGGGAGGSTGGAVTIVSDANGSLFWCSASVSNGTTTYSYQPLPGYTGAPTLPVSALEGQQLTNAKSQYAVQLMTSDGVNPTNAVERVYSTLYTASAAGVGYSVGDTLRSDETYTYATGTWATVWSNVTTNTSPITAPASLSSVSATTGRIITSHTDSQDVLLPGASSSVTQTRTYTVDINEPGAIASDTGWA